jgi:hypothetical protein
MKRPEITIDVYRRSDASKGPYELVRYIDFLESRVENPIIVEGSARCPLCGVTGIHQHSAIEQTIYRNGVKAGRSQSDTGAKP